MSDALATDLIERIILIGRDRSATAIRNDGGVGKPFPEGSPDYMVDVIRRQIETFGADAVLGAWSTASLQWRDGEPSKPWNYLKSDSMIMKYLKTNDMSPPQGYQPKQMGIHSSLRHGNAGPLEGIKIVCPAGTRIKTETTDDGVVITISAPPQAPATAPAPAAAEAAGDECPF